MKKSDQFILFFVLKILYKKVLFKKIKGIIMVIIMNNSIWLDNIKLNKYKKLLKTKIY